MQYCKLHCRPRYSDYQFPHWHVEALLNEAAILIERCLVDFKQYSALDFAWNQFQTDLETQEKQLNLDQKSEVRVETEVEAKREVEWVSNQELLPLLR